MPSAWSREWLGALGLGAAGALILLAGTLSSSDSQTSSTTALLANQRAFNARLQHLQMLKWKSNPTDPNPFESFDSDFKQGKFKSQKLEKNPFKNFDKGYKAPKYRALKEEENPLAEMPDNYPFDETAGGHEWKEWVGDNPMEALHEKNALDMGTKDSSFQIGEHSLGRPFKQYKPDKNVFDSLDDDEHEWKAYKPEKNILDSLSPDSGYDGE